MEEKKHLPVIGVGPIIIVPQLILTALGIALSCFGFFDFAKINFLQIPFFIIAVVIILIGVYLWYSANYKAKVFDSIVENKLIVTGVYSVVRNPIYSAFFMICIGAVLIANNLILFVIPVICWIYMTVFLKKTEEKWLADLYGQEYKDYCKKVNRCIPWFPKR
ncbi:MAG: isoprenylcysteine carboxylmethyltransferase family protein [Acutalibacteraceae bacterium]|nr:isoprenylcysteine carboxylmethyltransferase family protein [Acutalibacteraceae bacterium]